MSEQKLDEIIEKLDKIIEILSKPIFTLPAKIKIRNLKRDKQ